MGKIWQNLAESVSLSVLKVFHFERCKHNFFFKRDTSVIVWTYDYSILGRHFWDLVK
jgi:hypothetical protein